MVDGIGKGTQAREAILSVLRQQDSATRQVEDAARKLAGSAPAAGAAPDSVGFAEALTEGLAAVDREVQAAEALPAELLSGRVEDFHEVAVRLKQADLSFRFALEIRNKLVEAYREVMRMNV